jgi:hypothetical protein
MSKWSGLSIVQTGYGYHILTGARACPPHVRDEITMVPQSTLSLLYIQYLSDTMIVKTPPASVRFIILGSTSNCKQIIGRASC